MLLWGCLSRCSSYVLYILICTYVPPCSYMRVGFCTGVWGITKSLKYFYNMLSPQQWLHPEASRNAGIAPSIHPNATYVWTHVWSFLLHRSSCQNHWTLDCPNLRPPSKIENVISNGEWFWFLSNVIFCIRTFVLCIALYDVTFERFKPMILQHFVYILLWPLFEFK